MKKIKLSLVLSVCLIMLLAMSAYAAELSVVDYWNQVTKLTLVSENLQSEAFNSNNSEAVLNKTISETKQIQGQLKKLKPPAVLKENHQLRLVAMNDLVIAMNVVKDMSKNKDAQIVENFNKIKKAMQEANDVQKNLAVICQKQAPLDKTASVFQKDLCVYWSDMTEKECGLTDDLQNLMQSSVELMQTKNPFKFIEVLAGFDALNSKISDVQGDMQAYKPTEDMVDLHDKNLAMVAKVKNMVDELNVMLQNGDFANMKTLDKQGKEVEIAYKEYNSLLKTMLDQK